MLMMKPSEDIRREFGIRLMNRDSLMSIYHHYRGMPLNNDAFRRHLDRAFEWDTMPEGFEFWQRVSRAPLVMSIEHPQRPGQFWDIQGLIVQYFFRELTAGNPLMVDLSRYNIDDDE
jgi:hypothetical protein